ncbi:MAG: zf-HC2 domain-containing protein [Bacillota bacterium]
MRCNQIHRLRQAYLDDALSPDEERQLERHLRGCVFCRKRLVDMARVINRISDAKPVAPSADFTRRLLEKLGRDEATGRDNHLAELLREITRREP